jgi:hypothetical protein
MALSDEGVCGGSAPAIAPHPQTGRPSLAGTPYELAEAGTPYELAEITRALEAESAEVVARRLGLSAEQVALVEAAADRLGA